MKFQGLLLATIILVSIFITSPHSHLLTQRRKTNSQFLVETVKSQETAAVLEITSVPLTLFKQKGEGPKISAQVFLKRLLNTNVNLAEQKTKYIWPVASLTKLMTALVAIEKIDLNTEIKLSEKVVEVEAEGIIRNFKADEIYKASDLLKAMLVVSSNGAAEALAESYGEQNFISAMNQKAAELGMNDTKYFDSTGLNSQNQSTANDLAKLVNYIYFNFNHPEILNITQQKTISITELNSGQTKSFNSMNEFAGQPNFLGGKTGFIDESKGNLISLFQDPDGRGPILIIVLGSEDRFGDTRKLLEISN